MTAGAPLLRLIATGQYERFGRELSAYLDRADTSEPRVIGELVTGLNTALTELKMRRAHDERQLAELRAAAAYFVRRSPGPVIDIVG